MQTVALWYDTFNDLIGRTWTPYTSGSPGTPQSTRFVYDLPSPLAGEGSGVRGSGNAALAFTGNQSLTDRYLWGPAVDQILADERFAPSGSNWMPTTSAGTTYFALGDNEGSVRDWITYGSLVDHVVYDSFGKIYSQSSTGVPFNFGHNGVFYDPATGLEYHSQPSTGIPGRWYNPSIQRWMSEDPTGLTPDSDPYRYCENTPTNGIDPSGLDCWIENTESTGGLHQRITVTTHNLDGSVRGSHSISFGWDEKLQTGIVYVDEGKTPEEYPDSRIKLTWKQDLEVEALFDKLVGRQGWYTAVPSMDSTGKFRSANCADFSHQLHDDIATSVKKGNPGRIPKHTTFPLYAPGVPPKKQKGYVGWPWE